MPLTSQLLKSKSLVRLRELSEQLDFDEFQLRHFFQKSADLLAIVGDDGSFHRLNSTWQKILGWTEEELATRPWLSLLHPDDQQFVSDKVGNVAANRFCCRVQGRDRKYRVVEFSTTWCDGFSSLVGRLAAEACLSCPEALSQLSWRARGCDNSKQGSD